METQGGLVNMDELLAKMAEILISCGNFKSVESSPHEIYPFATPLFVDAKLYEKMIEVQREVRECLDVLAKRARKDWGLARRLLGIKGPLEMGFLLMDHGYTSMIPIVRSDLALDKEGRIFLLEVNCGCPGGELDPAVVADAYFKASGNEPKGLFCDPRGESLEGILKSYEEFRQRRPEFPQRPRVGLVTSRAQKWFMVPECNGIAQYYRAMGLDVVVGEMEELDYVGGKILLRGNPLELIFRKFSTQSLKLRLTRPESFPDEAHGAVSLWRALEDSAVCMVNPLSSTFFQDKGLLAILREEFPKLENVIPETHILDEWFPQTNPSLYEEILRGESFVLKKRLSFSGRHVIMAPQEIQKRVPEILKEEPRKWVAQRKIDLAKGFFGALAKGRPVAGEFPFVVSLFGQSAYVRVGLGASVDEPINAHMGSATTFLIPKTEKEESPWHGILFPKRFTLSTRE